MIALIDADSMIYKAGFGCEDAIDWGDGDTTYVYDMPSIKKTIDKMIDGILFATGCGSFELHLSGKGNFRYDVARDYKHNRTDTRKPEWIDDTKEWMIEHLGAVLNEGWEADDMVVYLKTKYPEDYILCAIDKDVLCQTVGTHYNYGKQIEHTTLEWDALKFKYLQTIAGDSVDGYKGVPGLGMKRAEKLLLKCQTERELWVATLLAYRSKGMKRSEAIATMRLADMHQLKKNSIVLWTPPQR